MPKDYKNRAQGRNKPNMVSPWTGLFSGLAIGLFVAFLVYLKMLPNEGPRIAAVIDDTAEEPVLEAAPETRDQGDQPAEPPRPRFDFYTLLPEMEIVIPEQEITGKTEAGIRQVEEPGTYQLQVGSFRSLEQAERFKAELTLLGLEPGIQKVTINNTDTFHRVRVGPFKDLGSLNKARELLIKQGIESKLIRLAD